MYYIHTMQTQIFDHIWDVDNAVNQTHVNNMTVKKDYLLAASFKIVSPCSMYLLCFRDNWYHFTVRSTTAHNWSVGMLRACNLIGLVVFQQTTLVYNISKFLAMAWALHVLAGFPLDCWAITKLSATYSVPCFRPHTV